MDVHYLIEFCIAQNVNSIAQNVQDVQKWQMYQAHNLHPLDIIDQEVDAQMQAWDTYCKTLYTASILCLVIVLPCFCGGSLSFFNSFIKPSGYVDKFEAILATLSWFGFAFTFLFLAFLGHKQRKKTFEPHSTYCIYMASITWNSQGRPERPAKFIAKSKNPKPTN